MSDLMYALYARITSAALSLRDREQGQSMVEYSLIILLVAVGAVAAFTGLKDKIGSALTEIGTHL
jgi:Flp pilus assembly pilin Flp